MGLTASEVRSVVEQVFAMREVLDACARRDLGAVITVLGAHGVTQGRISELTSISQGRLSEWVNHKREPQASSVFEAFANGLAVPPAARQALGLAPVPLAGSSAPAGSGPGPGRSASVGGRGGPSAGVLSGTGRLAPRVPADLASAGVSRLQGLDAVRGQLDVVIAVLKAERVRAKAGPAMRRRMWKNLVFTGGPGSGKSRAAAAVGESYRKLGVLSSGRVQQMSAGDLVGSGPEETGKLVGEAFRLAAGGILLVNGAHAWDRLPDHGDQVLRRLYENLNEYRDTLDDEVAVILAGEAGPLRRLLHGNPPLAARFRAVVDFPGYSPAQLAVIFAVLADEAGLRLTTSARTKAAAVLARAEGGRPSGNARLAVAMLNQATANQARRVATEAPLGWTPGAASTITDADIPESLHPGAAVPGDDWPGQYL